MNHDPGWRARGVPIQGFAWFASVWVLLFCVWGFANGPALTSAWWYLDDFYKFGNPQRAVPHVLSLGRPLVALWELTFWIDANPHRTWQNIAFRVFQGGIHCAVGTVVAMILWRERRTWGAVLSVLPFLLWPFNAEAVLWRSAGIYPLAALCGVVGMCCIQYPGRRPLLAAVVGALIIAAGMLFNQAAAFSGLVVQLLVSTLMVMHDRIDWRAQCCRMVVTCGGYALGAVISAAVAHFRADPRVRLATDVPGKLRYLWKLNALFLGSPRYHTPWLPVLHIGLLSLMLLAVVAAVLSRRASWSLRRAGISVFMTATAFVTPYLGVLLVAENWPSQRVMYLAPLLITAAWNELDVALAALRANVAVALCPLLLITLGYASIARVNSAEYVTLFHCDLEVLRRIESYAAHERVTTVFVAPPPDNVYGLAYGAKLSAFYKDWAARYFIPAFSSLQSTYAQPESAACLTRCADTDSRGDRSLRFYAVQDGSLGCACWGTERMPAARLLAR